ncbi:MAG TPA: HisA/HisF-related TIM barrel protein [Gemmatimonadales bacterium]|nr:HisA/HisF-related TIM barrel protein [Gemmatimonadales bacterium]
MRIIPVLDLANGVAVHARAGDRPRYETVHSVLAPDADGDPTALLRAYRQALGAAECYVADLDAIQGGAVQRGLLRELAALAVGFPGPLLVDAGTRGPDGALEVLSCGASEVVVGLESLHAFADLAAIVELAGPRRVLFSLDLRLGSPIVHPALRDAAGAAPDAPSLAAQAVAAGARTLLALDIGRVGTGCGVDLDLLKTLRRRFPSTRLLAGGGVLTRRDLERMRDAGCDGALVASAIHTGRIGAADVTALADRPVPAGQSETSDSR